MWQERYLKHDYASMTFQFRQSDSIALCQKYLHADSHLLDLGCGCGHASITLAQLGYNVVGIDFCESMIKQAQHNAAIKHLQHNCTFEQTDFVKYNQTLGTYDGLIALGFIEYFDNPVTVLQKMHSLLTDQGIAIVQIWNSRLFADRFLSPLYRWYNKLTNPLQIAKNVAKRLLPATVVKALRNPVSVSTHSTVNVVHRRYTPDELAIISKKAGFEVIDARGSHFFPHQFLFSDERKIKWDKQLQAVAENNELVKLQAANYVAVLKKQS